MNKKYLSLAALFLGMMLMAPPFPAYADDNAPMLPDFVHAEIHAPLKLVGEGNYRKLGFKIYHASLWAPNGAWSADKPFALQIVYAKSLSKDTVRDAIMDDIKEQNVADDATLTRWQNQLTAILTAVEENDTIIALSIPGKNSLLFLNGKKIASIDEKPFSDAFFNIWLGSTANEDLRKKLLGQEE